MGYSCVPNKWGWAVRGWGWGGMECDGVRWGVVWWGETRRKLIFRLLPRLFIKW